MSTDHKPIKEIHYAYPTSIMAGRLGRGKEGCFYLQLACAGVSYREEGPFGTFEEAREEADKHSAPYGSGSFKKG